MSLALVKINFTFPGSGLSIAYPFGQPLNQDSIFITTVHEGLRTNFWEAPQPKCSSLIDKKSVTSSKITHLHDRQSHLEKKEIELMKEDPTCLKNVCSNTSFCFLGACFCHPGYEGKECSSRKSPSNPWYTASCPNLLSTSTADMTVPLHTLGGEYSEIKKNSKEGSTEDSTSTVRNSCVGSVNPSACAYLCYSHPMYGTAVVPHSLWHAAQEAEGNPY